MQSVGAAQVLSLYISFHVSDFIFSGVPYLVLERARAVLVSKHDSSEAEMPPDGGWTSPLMGGATAGDRVCLVPQQVSLLAAAWGINTYSRQ
jgi:hypothetical protein